MLAAIPRRAFLDVELKGDPGRGAFEVLTAGRGPGLERAVVSSFEPATLERIGRLAPSVAALAERQDLSRGDDRRWPSSSAVAAISVEWHAIDARIDRPRPRRRARGRRLDGPPPADVPPPGAARRRRDLRRGRGARRLTIAPTRRAPHDRRRRRRPIARAHERRDGSSRPRRRRGGHDRRLGVVLRRSRRRRAGRRPRARPRRPGRELAGPPGSSGPRAARRRPSRSAAGRSTSTTASQAERSAPTPGSASSAT